jgi:nitrate reductase delta subunit
VSYDEWADLFRYPREGRWGLPVEALQELYVATFEFNPACTLEIGWHLFGENYERGEFLVKMRDQLRRHGVAEFTELPDHLTHLLPLIARMKHDEAASLTGEYLLPALAKVRTAIGGKNNPYEEPLAALEETLLAAFPDAPRRPVELPIFQETACD